MVHPRQIAASAIMQGEGYPAESAAAWVGTFSQESGAGLPSAFRRGKLDHGSQGLPQWRDSKEDKRLTKYMDYVKELYPGASPDELWELYGNMALQLKYVPIECHKSFSPLEAQLRRGGDIDVLSDAICWHFEMPNRKLSGIVNRKKWARAVFDAAPHVTKSGHTQKNVDVSKATKAVKKSQAKLGAGTLASAAATFLHFVEKMPPGVMVAVLFVTAIVVIHGFAAAKAAIAKIPHASLKVGPLTEKSHPTASSLPRLEWSEHDVEAVASEVVAILNKRNALPAPQSQETNA